jgi:hypothetical protein
MSSRRVYGSSRVQNVIDGISRVGWLIADGGMPIRMRAAFLTDDQVHELAAVAARRQVPREAP